jgi:hypothetical protein
VGGLSASAGVGVGDCTEVDHPAVMPSSLPSLHTWATSRSTRCLRPNPPILKATRVTMGSEPRRKKSRSSRSRSRSQNCRRWMCGRTSYSPTHRLHRCRPQKSVSGAEIAPARGHPCSRACRSRRASAGPRSPRPEVTPARERAARRKASAGPRSPWKQTKVVVTLGVFCGLVDLLISYFNGCGACENDVACDGLFEECICTDNHLGEYCEDSCGEFGQVDAYGSACVCSGNYTGVVCYRSKRIQTISDPVDIPTETTAFIARLLHLQYSAREMRRWITR